MLHSREIRLALLGLGAALFLFTGLRSIWSRAGRTTPASAVELRGAVRLVVDVGPVAPPCPGHRRGRRGDRGRRRRGGEAQAQLSTATGSVMPVSSAVLGTPTGMGCAWASATTLTFVVDTSPVGQPHRHPRHDLEHHRRHLHHGCHRHPRDHDHRDLRAGHAHHHQPLLPREHLPRGVLDRRADRLGGLERVPRRHHDLRRQRHGRLPGRRRRGHRGPARTRPAAWPSPRRATSTSRTRRNNRIRRITPAGMISTFAGGPAASACSYTGRGRGTRAQRARRRRRRRRRQRLSSPTPPPLHPQGRHRRQRHPGRRWAARPRPATPPAPATAVSLSTPRGIDVDSIGHGLHRRQRAATACARSSAPPTATSPAAARRRPATPRALRLRRRLSAPNDVAVDGTGRCYVADTGRNCVRKVVGTTFSHVLGGGGDHDVHLAGAATAVSLSAPEGVAVDVSGTAAGHRGHGRRCVRAVNGTTYSLVALTGTNSLDRRQRSGHQRRRCGRRAASQSPPTATSWSRTVRPRPAATRSARSSGPGPSERIPSSDAPPPRRGWWRMNT